jgi:hypothetical protein
MTNRLSPKDQELLRIIDEVLHYVWDPIGVSGVPQARDEYGGYVGPVCTLLRSGATEFEISSHLEAISSDRMGLPGRKERADEAASILTDWRDPQAEAGP